MSLSADREMRVGRDSQAAEAKAVNAAAREEGLFVFQNHEL